MGLIQQKCTDENGAGLGLPATPNVQDLYQHQQKPSAQAKTIKSVTFAQPWSAFWSISLHSDGGCAHLRQGYHYVAACGSPQRVTTQGSASNKLAGRQLSIGLGTSEYLKPPCTSWVHQGNTCMAAPHHKFATRVVCHIRLQQIR